MLPNSRILIIYFKTYRILFLGIHSIYSESHKVYRFLDEKLERAHTVPQADPLPDPRFALAFEFQRGPGKARKFA